MKRIVVGALALVLAAAFAPARADFVYRGSDGSISRTHCDYHRVYGYNCYTSRGGSGNSARVIEVPPGDVHSDKPFICPSCVDASDKPYEGGEPSW